MDVKTNGFGIANNNANLGWPAEFILELYEQVVLVKLCIIVASVYIVCVNCMSVSHPCSPYTITRKLI